MHAAAAVPAVLKMVTYAVAVSISIIQACAALAGATIVADAVPIRINIAAGCACWGAGAVAGSLRPTGSPFPEQYKIPEEGLSTCGAKHLPRKDGLW